MKAGLEKFYSLLGLNVQGDLGDITCYTSKRRRVVWYLKAPPTKPASWLQNEQRNLFRMCGDAWRAQTDYEKFIWKIVQYKANLRISGYNLFCYVLMTGDTKILGPIEEKLGYPLPIIWKPYDVLPA